MRSNGWRLRSHARALACTVAVVALTHAQPAAAYPDRPVTMIVPFAPAGPTDIIARVLANVLSQKLGQQFVVDNRAGAAGNTGMGQVARATPDGYTLMVTSTAIAVNPALFKKLPYDPFKDFAPISELVNAPNVLVVRADSDIKTIADLVAQAKANPMPSSTIRAPAPAPSRISPANCSSCAPASTWCTCRIAAPVRPRRRCWRRRSRSARSRSRPPKALIQGGQLRALAVTSEKRWFSLPNVPTMIEAGYKDFVSDTFNAFFAPARVPQDILALLVKESRAAFQRPDVRDLSRKAGFEVVAGTPDELSARIKAEIPAVRELVAKAGIPLQ